MSSKVFRVKVTQLKISKPLLKVYVQNISNKRYSELQQLEALFKKASMRKIEPENVGSLFIGHIGSSKYERVRVEQLNESEQTALVLFIDNGYQGTLPYNQVSIYVASVVFSTLSKLNSFLAASTGCWIERP